MTARNAGWLGFLALGCASTARSSEATMHSRGPARSSSSAVVSAAPSAPIGSALPKDRAVEAAPSSSEWTGRLKRYYAELPGEPTRRGALFRSLFAERLERFIALRDVSRDQALSAVNGFFATHTAASYVLPVVPTVRIEDVQAPDRAFTRVSAVVDSRYDTAVPAQWVEVVPELEGASLTTAQRMNVELRATPSGEVFYYDEAPAPAAHRQRVARHTKGFAFPFVEPCWRDPGESELARTELRAGTVLEPTGRSVVVTSCGPGTSVDEFRLGKQRIWVLVALYELVPNPNGGSSLGGIDFLEIAD